MGEVLDLIAINPKTVEDVDKELCREYCLEWTNLSNTRRRMDWLEVLGLIENIGNRKWGLTEAGKHALEEWAILTPDAIESTTNDIEKIAITEPL